MMWSSVTPESVEEAAPSARSKHSATLCQGNVYLLGGRNGNLPLKDFWKYDLAEGKWTLLKPTGECPPCLQEHTAVSFKQNIYVFGGELGFSAGVETPLWVYDILGNSWRKIRSQKGVKVPKGRRGHTALVYRGSMLIYGGYQDLRGSTSELWAFHFETESWHLLSSPTKDTSNSPPPRHKHSAVLYDDHMFVFGGMTDLQERGDLWKFDTRLKTWSCIRAKPTPGPLHSHASCRLPSAMLIFGGERAGLSTNDLWRFSFDTESWEKINLEGLKPHPRAECVAFAVSEFLLKGNSSMSSNTELVRSARTKSRIIGDQSRHSSYLSSNRVSPFEKTYVFQPNQRNYIDNTDEKTGETKGFLKEINTKLSQINLNRLSQNRCSYSVLTTKNDSQESLLNKNSEIVETTPTRMVKSKSAYQFKKKVSNEECGGNTSKNTQENNTLGDSNRITREPISVPNFSTLVLPAPVLTPVEASKLVYLDSDEERDYQKDIQAEKGRCNNTVLQVQANNHNQNYDTFMVKRDESYISHLGYQDNPLYQNLEITSVGVKFTKVNETFDENSTSDYASIETVSHVSSSKTTSNKKSSQKGPFGFSNPNYLGPDIKIKQNLNENNETYFNESDKKKFQKNLNTPDSVLEESFQKMDSYEMYQEENVELQNITNNEKTSQPNFTNNKVAPKLDLIILQKNENKNNIAKKNCSNRFCNKHLRASSASRVETKITKKITKTSPKEFDFEKVENGEYVPLYIYVIGGKERGQITVFKRPVSIWKLKLF